MTPQDFFYLFDLLKKIEIWYIDIYIDVYIYKLFQTCSIQIDLVLFLTEGTIFVYIKTLDNVHNASTPVVAKSVLERKACHVSVAIAVLIIVC